MAELSPELQGCSVVEHFIFRSVRGELSTGIYSVTSPN